jgi:hypothetical protein
MGVRALNLNATPVVNTAACPAVRPFVVPQPVVDTQFQASAVSSAPRWEFTDVIKFGSRTFNLAKPLPIKLQQNSELFWEVSTDSLGIFSVGKSMELAFDDFQQEFAVIWDALAFESDDELTEDAQQLKAALRQLVKLP